MDGYIELREDPGGALGLLRGIEYGEGMVCVRGSEIANRHGSLLWLGAAYDGRSGQDSLVW